MTELAYPHKETSSRDYVNEFSCIFAIDIVLNAHKNCGITLEDVSLLVKKDVTFVKSHIFHLTSTKSSSKHHTVTSLRIEGDKYFVDARNCALSFEEIMLKFLMIVKSNFKIDLSQKYIASLRASDKMMKSEELINYLPTNKFSYEEIRKLNKLI